MFDNFYLAWRYLRFNWLTSLVLIAAFTLILYLPVGLQLIVRNAALHFRSRADATPLVIGAKGSPLELVLSSVYFVQPNDQLLRLREYHRVKEQKIGVVIPMHTRFSARDTRIVGTTTAYLNLRKIPFSKGTTWNILGECVVGARAAQRLNLSLGDKIPVSSSSPFLLDNPPLRLNVVGILEPTETPDDEVIFVNVRTAWILEGLGHGHTPGTSHGAPEGAVFTDISEENVSGFHFHGSQEDFPITSILIVPRDQKAMTILQGQYFSPESTLQIVRPREIMDELLSQVVMVQSYMIAIVAVVSSVTLLTLGLIVILSIRLRRSEIITMSKMGCSRLGITTILFGHILIILSVSCVIASSLAFATNVYGAQLVRKLIF